MMIVPIRLAMVDFLQTDLLALVIPKMFVFLLDFKIIELPLNSKNRLTTNATWWFILKNTYFFLSMIVDTLHIYIIVSFLSMYIDTL